MSCDPSRKGQLPAAGVTNPSVGGKKTALALGLDTNVRVHVRASGLWDRGEVMGIGISMCSEAGQSDLPKGTGQRGALN